MSKKIDSILMKSAVQQLFDYEIEHDGRVTSHSNLESWLVRELERHGVHSTSVKALTLCLKKMRGIELDMGDVEDDMGLLLERYEEENLYLVDTGGGCMAYRYTNESNQHYALVTIVDDRGIPESLHAPVQFGLYDEGDNLVHREQFKTSIEMFKNKTVNFILSC